MIQKNIRTLTIFFSLLITNTLVAQDIPFSNLAANALYINPAYAGVINRDVRLGLVYRSQGKSVALPYTTMAFQADLAYYHNRDKNDFFGFGVNGFKHDEGLGKYRQTDFLLSASYTKGLSQTMTDFLTIGFQGGISQRAMNIVGLKWDSQWDATRNIWNSTLLGEDYNVKNKDIYDMSFGSLFNKKVSRNLKFNVGVAAQHLFQPKLETNNVAKGANRGSNEYDVIRRKFTVHGTAEIATSDNATTVLVPSFIYSQKLSQKLFMLGLDLKFLKGMESKFTDYMKQTSISVGVSYRWKDALIPHFRMDYKDFSFLLAYDFTVSKLNAANKSSGAYEFGMLWNFKAGISSKNKPRVFKFIQ